MDATADLTVLGIELRDVRIPLLRTYRSAGTTIDSRRLITVRITAGDSAGWGEAAPVPGYSTDTAEDAWNELAALSSDLEAMPLSAVAAAATHLEAPSARHALETALADLQGRAQGRPVAEMLGGTPGPVAVGAVATTDASAADLIALQDAGFARIKVKVSGIDDFERAVERIAWAEITIPVAIDANGSLDPTDRERIAEIAGLIPLQFLEQPFPADQDEATARLAAASSTPLCLDESITGPAAASRAAATGARVVALKPARLGGLSAAVETAAAASSGGIKSWVGGLLESGIGRAASLALARAVGDGPAADLSPPSGYLAADLVGSPWTVLGGSVEVAASGGLGIEVDLDEVDRFTIAAAVTGTV